MRAARTRKQRRRIAFEEEQRSLYTKYMHSQAWRDFRNKILADRGMMCESCGSFEGHREVHHLTYANLGHEQPEDVLVLCGNYHFDSLGD
jgi:hypothetical protein